MPWVPSPNLAPGAGRALQLLSSRDPRMEGEGRNPCLGAAAAHVSQHQHPGCLAADQRCQNTQTQHFQVAPTFPQPLLVPWPLDMRYLWAHPHLGTSGHSIKSFQAAGPSPAAPPMCNCSTVEEGAASTRHSLRKDRINVIHVPGKEQASTTAKIKQKIGKKTWKTTSTGTSPTHKTTSGFWDRSSVLIPLRMEISVTLQR